MSGDVTQKNRIYRMTLTGIHRLKKKITDGSVCAGVTHIDSRYSTVTARAEPSQ